MKRITFGKYAGFGIKGVEKFAAPLPYSKDHVDFDPAVSRALWLTAMVETGGKFGSVQSYDGAGMTAGLHQEILVYPRSMRRQGPLARSCHEVIACVPTCGLLRALEHEGWKATPRGVIRSETDALVRPTLLRAVRCGLRGVAPVSGQQRDVAQRWVELWHDLYADPRTFDTQIAQGLGRIAARGKRIGYEYPDGDNELDDLAFAVYWSYDVNGPSLARKKLKKAGGNPIRLIRSFTRSSYGRWATKRYDRMRRHAKDSKLWSSHFFARNDVLPKRGF